MHIAHAKIMRNNALMNLNLLHAAKTLRIKRVFFSSSACVYPEYRQLEENSPSLKESDALPAWPDLDYGWEKLFSEFLYKSYEKDYGMKVRIARFHNIYGNNCEYDNGREKAPAALCRKVVDAKEDGKLVVWGDGKARRSFMFIDDCVECIWRLMNSDFREPLNIGTDKSIGVDELAKLIMKIAGKYLTIEHDLTQPEGVRGRNADLTLMKHVLHYTPKIDYPEGMSRLYTWVKNAKSQKPLVSVVIPTFNEAGRIEQVIGALHKQTYPNFEIIIADGGSKGLSTDGTVERAKRLGAEIIPVREGHVSEARNVGSLAGLGEIIVFTEADTLPPRTWLSLLIDEFDDDVLAVAGAGIPYDGTLLVSIEYAFYNSLRLVVSRLPRPLGHFSPSANNFAVRKGAFEKAGGFSSNLMPNDDGLLGRKLRMMGETKFSLRAHTFISARRWRKLGFVGTNLHYLYVLENFLNFTGPMLRRFKVKSQQAFETRN